MSKSLTQNPSPTSMAPRNLDEAMRFAELIAKSDFVPKDYRGKPGNIIVAIQMGAELGLAPMQAMQNIAVINGKPSVWGDAMLALCQAHPSFDDISETHANGVATCEVKRRDRSPVTRTFSLEDAKKAGLIGKQGPWSQYQQRMLQMRARSWALRDAFADVLRGVYCAEEAMDIPAPTTPPQAEIISGDVPPMLATGISLDNFTVRVRESENLEQLMIVAEDGKRLSSADRAAGQEIWKQRQSELRELHLDDPTE